MKIAILGGAFNPPHLGHILIAHQTLQFTNNQQIWLTPCYQHTFGKNLIPTPHRLKMIKLITTPHIQLCDIEIQKKLSGHTIQTLNILKNKYPHHQFTFIIGSDNLINFKKWGHWKTLITKNDFLIFPRPGYQNSLSKLGLNHHSYRFSTLNHPLLATSNISSTLIQKRITSKLAFHYLVPEKISAYIRKNRLYQSKS